MVDEIFVHENYSANGDKANDIALLRLGTNIAIVEPNVALLFDGLFSEMQQSESESGK